MTIEQRIQAFSKLGAYILQHKDCLKESVNNPWFTDENINLALNETANALKEANLLKWVAMYPHLQEKKKAKRVGVITAGNIPLVGFHDFLSVLISGHIFVGKLSSKDDILLSRLVAVLKDIEPGFADFIFLSKEKPANFDAVIATGSNNSMRYFEYYFGKYPHILRKNRNSVAILDGTESEEELKYLADDIFLYFGLGCRSVSKIFLPENYDLNNIFRNSLGYEAIIKHNKYANNYDYNRAIYMMNKIDFQDNGILLMKEDVGYASPVSVLYFEYYSNLNVIKKRLADDNEKIQCIVSKPGIIENSVYFGYAQKPQLWDYADNVDTINFLKNI